MNNCENVINGIIERGRDEQSGDYKDENGLLCCGKCHQPKEARIKTSMYAEKVVPIACQCKQDELKQEEEKKQRMRAEEMRKQFLPREQMRSCRFENAENATHIRDGILYVEHWDEFRSDGSGLVFWGNTGTGKSFTALCIANALIDKLIPVRYCSAVDIVSDLMDKDKREGIFKTVTEVPLLIIDDIGAERNTEFSREQLCRVIDARIESGKPLICTTNYTLDEMKNTTDSASARMFDRLLSVCVPVCVVGESRRKALASERLKRAREIFAE